MKQFVIKTLGCKVNQSESENISAALQREGFVAAVPDTDSCPKSSNSTNVSICIINTCTVTEKASTQSRQAIRQAIRAYPNARIVVIGCYAQTQPEEIRKIEGVNDVLCREEKHAIVSKLLPAIPETTPGIPPGLWPNAASFDMTGSLNRRTRFFLKIQDGCNAHCTYCIVPRARGTVRSMPEDLVLSNIRALHDAGIKEVVLSGIHLGCYGLDFSSPSSLLSILKKIDRLEIIPRVRISSIEPGELSDEIIDLVASSPRFCHHFHIPLQSGDDGVLRRMGRFYSRDFFRDLVLRVHDRIPDAAIGLDVLVGFPGESDTAFENTYDLVASLPLSYLHVFPFSPRKSTPAYDMDDKVPAAVIKSRAARMRALGEKKRLSFHDTLVGITADVLAESAQDADTGWTKARTTNYVPVFLKNYTGGANRIVSAEIVKNLGKKGVLATPISFPAGP
jgi:threonylcarbamoyladenosine tRNA methylthiotransferase MtaB